MKLRTDVECLLMDFEYEEETQEIKEPFLRNFFAYYQGCRDKLTLWDFLWFLNHEMKQYKKHRGIESFAEFLDNKYPPKKKHPQKCRC